MTHSATWLRSRVTTCPGHSAARAQNADGGGVFSQASDIFLSCSKYKSGSGSIVNHSNVNLENFGNSEWLWAKVWQNEAARDEEGSKEWCSVVVYSSLPLVARHLGPITLLHCTNQLETSNWQKREVLIFRIRSYFCGAFNLDWLPNEHISSEEQCNCGHTVLRV